MYFNVGSKNYNLQIEDYNDTLSILVYTDRVRLKPVYNPGLKRRLFGKNQVATFFCHYFNSIKHSQKIDMQKFARKKTLLVGMVVVLSCIVLSCI